MQLRRPGKAHSHATHLFRPFLSRKAFSIGSIPSILLFLASIILAAILILLGMGFTKGGVEATIPNMEEFTSSYVLDTILGLADWDGECGCLAKGTIVSAFLVEKQVLYPGLVPVDKLDSMQDKCFGRVRKGSVIILKDMLIAVEGGWTYDIDEINGAGLATHIPVTVLPIENTTSPLPLTVPKQYITYERSGGSAGYALLVTAEPTEKTYLNHGNTIHVEGGWTKEVDYVISPPVCIASIGTTETYLDPYWKPWKMEVEDVETEKKWSFGNTGCPLLRYCKRVKVASNPDVYGTYCDPYLGKPVLYEPEWEEPATRIVSIDYGGVVHAGKATIQIADCKIDKEYQEVP